MTDLQIELDNAVKLVDPTRDALYDYSIQGQKDINNAKPWKADPHHFKNVRISAVALLKMVMHARSGGSIEVMGLMSGSVHGDTFVVTDAFRLPVEGTETRVNAQDDANEYMVAFTTRQREQGKMENVVGWYHSHPGYGCWLSGIDVGTQMTQQTFQDPFLAVVIDPDRTISAGKVEIGAFRTYPENYKPDAGAAGGTTSDGFQTIPLGKIEDFGAHSSRYYQLEVSHFKSTLDSHLLQSLWNKYWVQTLTSSPLFTNRDYGTSQIRDLSGKIKQSEHSLSQHKNFHQTMASRLAGSNHGDGDLQQLEKLVRASEKIAMEEKIGLMAAEVKDKVFSVGQQGAEKEQKAAEVSA